MARIAGINIPVQKHTWIALTSIYGIGRTRAREVCAAAGVDISTKVRDLSESEVENLRTEVGKHTVEGDLRRDDQAIDGFGLLSWHSSSPWPATTWATN